MVTFYLPMIPELAIGILACTRIGAIHAVVFGGFSADALASRIQDSESVMVVSCDGTFRGAKAIPQKANADQAIKACPTIHTHLVVERVGGEGKELEGECQGNLIIKRSWPGQMRGVYKNPQRFYETYFTQFDGVYTTGDGCKRDKDGYYQITGRVDDVINVSGHRMGTAEVESALVSHPLVAESAVVGYPHPIKGQSIYAFVTLNSGVEKTDELKKELIAHVRKEIGPIATPDMLQWSDFLPKTRSGKIMRRILKKVAAGDFDKSGMGDTSTLADPTTVDMAIDGAKQIQVAN